MSPRPRGYRGSGSKETMGPPAKLPSAFFGEIRKGLDELVPLEPPADRMTPEEAVAAAEGSAKLPPEVDAAIAALHRVTTRLADAAKQPSWHNKRRTLSDAVACLVGRHHTAQDGRLSDGLLVERCSCGATRLGGRRGWIRETWWRGPREGWS
jgi:hypothetical protein